uniref:Uncharacterized protein n=1 Tax=Glossina austeni TaxID=7395 RepID=A0A1A9UDE5_GLOAU
MWFTKLSYSGRKPQQAGHTGLHYVTIIDIFMFTKIVPFTPIFTKAIHPTNSVIIVRGALVLRKRRRVWGNPISKRPFANWDKGLYLKKRTMKKRSLISGALLFFLTDHCPFVTDNGRKRLKRLLDYYKRTLHKSLSKLSNSRTEAQNVLFAPETNIWYRIGENNEE